MKLLILWALCFSLSLFSSFATADAPAVVKVTSGTQSGSNQKRLAHPERLPPASTHFDASTVTAYKPSLPELDGLPLPPPVPDLVYSQKHEINGGGFVDLGDIEGEIPVKVHAKVQDPSVVGTVGFVPLDEDAEQSLPGSVHAREGGSEKYLPIVDGQTGALVGHVHMAWLAEVYLTVAAISQKENGSSYLHSVLKTSSGAPKLGFALAGSAVFFVVGPGKIMPFLKGLGAMARGLVVGGGAMATSKVAYSAQTATTKDRMQLFHPAHLEDVHDEISWNPAVASVALSAFADIHAQTCDARPSLGLENLTSAIEEFCTAYSQGSR